MDSQINIQSISSLSSKTHNLHKRTWNILQKRSHTGSHIRSQPVPKDCDHSLYILDDNALKLEINHKRKFGRKSNTWRLKSILLKNDWVNQEIKEKFKKFMETNKNENTTVQNLWDAAKEVLRG